jgi:microcystin-dependent protein
MSDQYVGEIRPFACNFAPIGFAFCNGQTLAIQTYPALFAILGTNYGGDGSRTFQLPNLQGAAPMSFGQGPGLTARSIGESVGVVDVTLVTNEMPMHTHGVQGDSATRDSSLGSPAGAFFADGAGTDTPYSTSTSPTLTGMNPQMVTAAGGSQPHNNMMPYSAINFCIALQGIFPARP